MFLILRVALSEQVTLGSQRWQVWREQGLDYRCRITRAWIPLQDSQYRMSCPRCPDMAVLLRLWCPGWPFSVVLSKLPCPCCMFWLSSPRPFSLSSTVCAVLTVLCAVLSRLYCPCCPIQALLSPYRVLVVMLWLASFLSVLSLPSCPKCRVLNASPGHSALAVLSWLS
jgi:hypothetical protein